MVEETEEQRNKRKYCPYLVLLLFRKTLSSVLTNLVMAPKVIAISWPLSFACFCVSVMETSTLVFPRLVYKT